MDECHTTNACDSNADCSDVIGGFECTCRSGYTGNGTYCQGKLVSLSVKLHWHCIITTCLDVDECSAGLHNCSDYANCYNTEGGFGCHCKVGFTGDGFHCASKQMKCH